MKKLYLDCGMGAAGDMLTAALLELCGDKDETVRELNALGVPGVRYEWEPSVKCGITGTHMRVLVGSTEEHEHMHTHTHEHHHHSGMEEIEHWISHIHASPWVKENIHAVYHRIAQAESKVHGVEITEIHFHEVGTLDAVADVTAVCYLLDKLGRPQVYASPVHVGSGHVYCAHGILPVPAPATAEILKGVPVYGGQINGELCTPTGAALLKQFVTRFGDMPVMVSEAVGYGMGKKDFAIANCVRAILGEDDGSSDTILELACNIDDMTAEEIGFAMEMLLEAGALDVYTQPIGMKKNRPGTMLTVLCRPGDRRKLLMRLITHTTTLGVRETLHQRFTMLRETEEVSTPFGPIRKKTASGLGIERSKYEYEDLARAAREYEMSLAELKSYLK